MATESKDVELRVRARDYSQKTLDGVTKALDELTQAQAKQLDGAKKGQVSAKALADSYDKIENAVKALIAQNALTKVFQSNADALDKAKASADKAREAQTAYANSLAGVETKTKDQIKAQEKLASAVQKTEKAQLTAQTRLDRTVAKLAEYGIAATDVEKAQQRMAAGVAVGNAALDRQAAALDSIDADLARNAAAQKAAAAASAEAAAKQVAADRLMADSAKAAAEGRYRALAQQDAAEKASAKLKADTARVAAEGQYKLLALQEEEARAAAKQVAADRMVAESMRQAAQQAEAASKGYLTLARSVKSVRGDELAAQLRAIIDPSGVALQSISGIDQALVGLSTTVGKINGPVKNFKATLLELQAVQKGVGAIGASIDAYKRQRDVLVESTTAFRQAQNSVRELAAAMRAGGGDAAELGRQMASAQANLRNTAAAVQEQGTKLRAMRADLAAAGVDTRNLGDAEAKLVAQATQATGALSRLTAAFKQHGAAAEGAGKSVFKFFDSTRSTLSFTQRLRGEIIGLTTAYVGLNAVLGVAKASLDTYNEAQKIQAQLGAAFGNDAAVIAKEWDYLMGAANRIGISFREAAPAYAKFAIAAKSFGFNGQDIRDTFEGLAKASRVAGLSASDFEGVLKAVEQMLSKGTIQAEELRGQLGDRLPGAFTMLAAATNRTGAELSKAMEAGLVGAEELLPFVDKLGEKFAYTTEQSKNLASAQSRFNNALLEFQLMIANSGFADEFTKLLNDITTFLLSPQGKEFATGIGEAFTAVIKVIRFLVQHLEEVKTVLTVLLAIGLAKWVKTAVLAFGELFGIITEVVAIFRTATGVIATAEGATVSLGGAATATAGSVATLGSRIVGLAKVLPTFTAIVAGAISATKALIGLDNAQNNLAGRTATGKITDMGTGLPITVGSEKGDGPSARDMGPQRQLEAFNKEAAKAQAKLDKDRQAALKKQAKDELGERADLIKAGFDLQREEARGKIKDAALASQAIQTIDKQEKQALETDRIRFNAENAKSGAAAANKEVTLREKVKNELLKIRDDLAKAETKVDNNATFEERQKTRLDAISHSYDKLKKDIATLGTLDKAAAAEATKKLNVYIGQLQAVESIKVTTDEVKKLEKELTDQMQLRESLLRVEKSNYDAGLITQEEFLKNTAEINTRAESAITVAANNLQGFVDAAVKAKAGILSLTEQADVKAKTTGALADVASTDNRINDARNKAELDAIDNLVAKRKAAEEIFRAQFELRMITEDEYAARMNSNTELYKAKTLEMIQSVLKHIEAEKALGILNGTISAERLAALDAQIAKLNLLGVTTANAASVQDTFNKALTGALSSGIDGSLNALVDAMTELAKGTMSTSQAFEKLGVTVLQIFAQMLQQIALAIAKQLILNAIASSGGVFGQAAAAAGGVASRKHSGGKVGHGVSGVTRRVDPGLFANAPRFHEGGFPGLKSNEVPAILQTGEQVLARDDPNNVLNGTPAASKNRAGPGTRVVLVDDRAKVPEAMQSAEGENVIMQVLRRNSSTVKQLAR